MGIKNLFFKFKEWYIRRKFINSMKRLVKAIDNFDNYLKLMNFTRAEARRIFKSFGKKLKNISLYLGKMNNK